MLLHATWKWRIGRVSRKKGPGVLSKEREPYSQLSHYGRLTPFLRAAAGALASSSRCRGMSQVIVNLGCTAGRAEACVCCPQTANYCRVRARSTTIQAIALLQVAKHPPPYNFPYKIGGPYMYPSCINPWPPPAATACAIESRSLATPSAARWMVVHGRAWTRRHCGTWSHSHRAPAMIF
jgi:hypothetical protein